MLEPASLELVRHGRDDPAFAGRSGRPVVHPFPYVLRVAFIVVAPIVIAGYQSRGVLDRPMAWLLKLALVGLIATFGKYAAQQIYATISNPPEWDFRAFWLYGRVGAQKGNFYTVAAMHRAGDSLPWSANFRREVLDVGFPYPPATMLLTAPLGRLEAKEGALAWELLQVLALAASVLAMWRIFLPDSGAHGLGVVAALALGLSATQWTLRHGQTNAWTLLFLLLFWETRSRALGGWFLALGLMIKPVFGFLGLWPLLVRQWRMATVACISYALLSALALLLFGWPTFRSFFVDNPTDRIPGWLYTGHNNMGLLAFILRWRTGGELGREIPSFTPWADPLFLAVCALLFLVTIPLAYRLIATGQDLHRQLALALLVPLALLLYPQSQNHYSMLLLPPMLLLWTRGREIGIAAPVSIAVITAVYWSMLPRGGDLTVLGNALLWMALVAGAGLALRARGRPLVGGTPRVL